MDQVIYARKNSSGFTMVEIVLVIAIVGLLSVIALPRYFAQTTFSSRFFYDDVLSSLHYAQKYAVATGCRIEFRPDFPGGSLTLVRAQNCTSGTFNQSVYDPAFNAASYSRTAPSGASFSSANAFPVFFDALGRAHATTDAGVDNGVIGTFTITVGSRTITLTGETGFAQ